ncbi:hypothetical protein HZS_7421 [Henneguya salminicola]|nr:hypothetical protein HZS_7421 [Henneguya salminicola]
MKYLSYYRLFVGDDVYVDVRKQQRRAINLLSKNFNSNHKKTHQFKFGHKILKMSLWLENLTT